ncbi:MAG TPA: hypothetical protein VE863_05790 [Pyrinomonadaceae bacterium]|jgi:hypothetical protein|nr:hypothetical protein [Pyrinomonadaceae bacterium]
MKQIFILIALVLTLSPAIFAQANPKADGFGGLVLNKSTAEDATRILGQPASDQTDRLDVQKLGKWLDARQKEKIFRQLSFKNVGDFSRIQLSFLENKLVVIELDFKKTILPERLDKIFGVEFAVIGGQTGPSDLPNEPGKYPVRFTPTAYPFNYNLIGISAETFIWVDCSTGDAARPGRIDKTRQISRVLQKK